MNGFKIRHQHRLLYMKKIEEKFGVWRQIWPIGQYPLSDNDSTSGEWRHADWDYRAHVHCWV